MAIGMPIIDGVAYIKTLVDAMDGAGGYALETSARLVNYLRPAILTSFLIYVIMWGWAVMQGMVSELLMDGVMRLVKLGIVIGLVLGFGGSGYFDDGITQEQVATFGHLTAQKPITPGVTNPGSTDFLGDYLPGVAELESPDGDGIYTLGKKLVEINGIPQVVERGNNKLYIKYVYDFVWNGSERLFQFVTGHETSTIVLTTQALSFFYILGFDYLQEGLKISQDANPDLLMFGLGSVTVLAGTMLGATIITTLVFAKFMMAILLAVGPIFITLVLFEKTRRVFEAWLGQVVSVIVLLLLFGVAINLVLGVLWEVLTKEFYAYLVDRVVSMGLEWLGLSDMDGSSSSAPSPVQGMGLVMVCYVCHLFLSRIAGVADSIGRSVSLNLQTGLARK